MLLFRMLVVALRLAWPYLLAPWRSPLLRWRVATYGLLDAHGRALHAEDVTPADLLRFALRHRAALLRFLRWAASL